jgi:hypothetical protein
MQQYNSFILYLPNMKQPIGSSDTKIRQTFTNVELYIRCRKSNIILFKKYSILSKFGDNHE